MQWSAIADPWIYHSKCVWWFERLWWNALRSPPSPHPPNYRPKTPRLYLIYNTAIYALRFCFCVRLLILRLWSCLFMIATCERGVGLAVYLAYCLATSSASTTWKDRQIPDTLHLWWYHLSLRVVTYRNQ